MVPGVSPIFICVVISLTFLLDCKFLEVWELYVDLLTLVFSILSKMPYASRHSIILVNKIVSLNSSWEDLWQNSCISAQCSLLF